MAKKAYEEQFIANIAASIREKTGSDKTYKTAEMSGGVNEVYEAGYENGKNDVDTETIYNEGLEAGKQAEREAFWDKYQNYGNRTAYSYAFAGDGWRSTGLLPPKYPMVLTAGATTNLGIFKQFKAHVGETQTRYDMTEICKLLDTSQGTVLSEMFADAYAENITLDLSNCTTATSMFNCGMRGGSIDKVYLKVTEKLKSVVSMFTSCPSLQTIIFTDDSIINAALSFNKSSKLTDESVDSIVNALKDLTGTTSKTLTVHETVYNRMVERGVDALVTAKNWILAKA